MQFDNLDTSFSSSGLDIDKLNDNPHVELKLWVQHAIDRKCLAPTAMVVASSGPDNQPDARVVLLKEITEHGLIFYTNYHSKKGQDICKNPKLALNFYWPELERQVRIQGVATKLDSEKSKAYFYSRPVANQIASALSRQSQVLTDKIAFEAQFKSQDKNQDNIKYPEHWGGFEVTPTRYEFYKGRPARVSDRVLYQKKSSAWQKLYLYP